MSITRRAFVAGTSAGAFGALGVLATPALANRRTHQIDIRNFAFTPDRSEVHTGDRIQFTNHDLTPHTATGIDASWDTGTLNRNESITLTVGPDWSAEYFCAFHPQMKAALVIEGR